MKLESNLPFGWRAVCRTSPIGMMNPPYFASSASALSTYRTHDTGCTPPLPSDSGNKTPPPIPPPSPPARAPTTDTLLPTARQRKDDVPSDVDPRSDIKKYSFAIDETMPKHRKRGSAKVFRGGGTDASRPATESETTISSGGGRGDGGDEARLKKKKGTTPCFFAHSLPEHPKSLTSALWPLTTAQDGRGRNPKGEVVCLLAPSRRRARAVGGARGHVSVGVWKTRVGGLAPNVVGTKFPALSDSFWAGEGPPSREEGGGAYAEASLPSLAVIGARDHVSVVVFPARVGGRAPNTVGAEIPASSDSFWA